MKNLFKLLIISMLGIILIPTISWAWCSTDSGANAVYSGSILVPVTATPTIILPFDPARKAWNVHPEGTTNSNIRCEFGLSNGQPAPITPTPSIGQEFVGNGYYSNCPTTPANLSVTCVSESGGTVSVDVNGDY